MSIRLPAEKVFSRRAAQFLQRAERPFVELLELKARRIAQQHDPEKWDRSATAMFDREIAFTLHMIDEQRSLTKDLRQSLRDAECKVDTSLLQLDARWQNYYIDHRFLSHREQLRGKLLAIDEERRRMAAIHVDKMDRLTAKLLELVESRETLGT